jgi:hypothetical protein
MLEGNRSVPVSTPVCQKGLRITKIDRMSCGATHAGLTVLRVRGNQAGQCASTGHVGEGEESLRPRPRIGGHGQGGRGFPLPRRLTLGNPLHVPLLRTRVANAIEVPVSFLVCQSFLSPAKHANRKL